MSTTLSLSLSLYTFTPITDKASIAFEAQDEFYIAKLLVQAGSEVPVGSGIMITVEEESNVNAFVDYVAVSDVDSTPQAPAPVPAPSSPAPAPAPISVPAPVAAVIPVPVSAPAPVSNATAPTPQVESTVSQSTQGISGFVSVRWGTGPKKTALSKKLAADQNEYLQKYGRTGHQAQ